MDSIGTRVRLEREAQGIDRKELARLTGIGYSTISELERGGMQTSTKLRVIADSLGVSLRWLETGKGPKAAAEPAPTDDEYTDVVGYSQAVGLGAAGAEAMDYAETHSLKFKKSSLRRRGILNKPLAVYYGKGDSMEPTIMDGDAILFDSSDTRPVDDVLYVIQVAGNGNPEYFVKRAEVLDDGTVLFRTDNPAGDHNWKRSKRMDSKKHPITVIGRVHWIGGWAD